jgi:hypothetical protein
MNEIVNPIEILMAGPISGVWPSLFVTAAFGWICSWSTTLPVLQKEPTLLTRHFLKPRFLSQGVPGCTAVSPCSPVHRVEQKQVSTYKSGGMWGQYESWMKKRKVTGQ